MDNVGNSNPNPNRPDAHPVEGGANPPVRPEGAAAASAPNVSRAPLNLGAGTGAPVAPAAPKAPVVRPAPPKPPVPSAAAARERITTCKTFFTKLHPGAILFLEGQINEWLKNNPAIVIKQTDVTVGEVLEKKAEPSLIIVIWY